MDASERHPQAGYDPFLSLQAESPGWFARSYRQARRFTSAWKRRLVKRLTPPGSRILDLGCGTGEFIAALRDDYDVTGVEPEPDAARWAREQFGLAVYTGGWEALPAGAADFDLITMWHVLEHLPEPLSILKQIRDRLTPAGKLLIALPNPSSPDAVIYRSEWVALDAPRHLWHFTPASLARLAAKAGFRLQERRGLPLDLYYNIIWSERLKAATYGRRQFLLTPLRVPAALSAGIVWGAATGSHSGMLYLFA